MKICGHLLPGLIWALILLGIHLLSTPPAMADLPGVTTVHGVFAFPAGHALEPLNGSTYSLAYPTEAGLRNGHVMIFNHGTIGIHNRGPLSDDASVAANCDLVPLGYTVASFDYGENEGWRVVIQADNTKLFADFLHDPNGAFPWLENGNVYLWGASRGGWLTLISLTKYPDVYAGGVASGGVSDVLLSLPYRAYHTFWSMGLLVYGLARSNLQTLGMGSEAVVGPFRDRETGEINSSLVEFSPAHMAASLEDPVVLVMGDSDMQVGAWQWFNFIDTLDGLGKSDLYMMFNVPASGHRSPAPPKDEIMSQLLGCDIDFRTIAMDWAEGDPFSCGLAPGAVFGVARDVSTDTVPSILDVTTIDPLGTPTHPGLLAVKHTLGTGSWPNAFSGTASLADFDENPATPKTFVFGNFEGFLEEWDLGIGTPDPPRRVWRSSDLGSRLFGLAIGNFNNDTVPDIACSDDQGRIRILDGGPGHPEIASILDPEGASIWHMRALDLEGDGRDEILLRTEDGYLFAYRIQGGTLSVIDRSEWVAPSPHAGFDVGQIDDDSALEIVLGHHSGFVTAYQYDQGFSRETLPTPPSDYLKMFPWHIKIADFFQGAASPAEILVSGTTSGYGVETGSVFALRKRQLQQDFLTVAAKENFDGVYSSAAHDFDGDGTDELVLCIKSGSGPCLPAQTTLVFIDVTNNLLRRAWPDQLEPSVAISDSLFHTILIEDVDGDGRVEVIAQSREGSIYVLDVAYDGNDFVVTRKKSVDGMAGSFGLELAQLPGDPSERILLGNRLNNLLILSGSTGLPLRTFNQTNGWVEKWAHRIMVGELDNDSTRPEFIVGTGNGMVRGANQTDGFVNILHLQGSSVIPQFVSRECSVNDPFARDGSYFAMAIADVDGDGFDEVVAGTDLSVPLDPQGGRPVMNRAALHVFGYDSTSRSYREESTLTVEGHDLYGMACGDVKTGDEGAEEILVGDRRGYIKMYQFIRNELTEIGRSADLGTGIGDIRIVDFDGNPQNGLEILVGFEEGWVKFLKWRDGAGVFEVLAQTPDLGTHAWGVCPHDFDGDGTLDLAVGNANGSLFLLNGEDLSIMTRVDGLGAFVGAYGALRVGNVDDDPEMELVAGSSGYVYVFDIQ